MFRRKPHPAPEPIGDTVRRPATPGRPEPLDPLQQIAHQLARIAEALEAANRLRK